MLTDIVGRLIEVDHKLLSLHPMIRLTELRLPIDHAPEDLEVAICKKLAILAKDLIRYGAP